MKIYNFIKKIFNQVFNRKGNIMSLEKQAEGLLEAVTNLISSITVIVNRDTTTTAVVPDSDSTDSREKSTKKELLELKKTAKAKAGSVLKKLGKEKLEELLSRFGSGKFSELLNESDVFNDFIKKADEMLSEDHDTPGSEDDDLLSDGPVKEHTLEDVKALLLKINNAPTLGRDVTRQILADLGVARLPELKKEKFAAAVEKIEATLKDASVE